MELHNGYKFKLDAGDKAMYTGMDDPQMQIVHVARSEPIVEIGNVNFGPMLKSITVDGAPVEHADMVDLLNRRGTVRIVLTLEGELTEIKQVKP